jgi:hypothetical protein
MIYKSVLVLFTMFAGVFAANDVFCGDISVIQKNRPCHAGCGKDDCHFKKPRKLKNQLVTDSTSVSSDVSNESQSPPLAFAHKTAALPQQELVVSRVDNSSILHTVSSDASKPMVLTSIVDAKATELSGPAAVVISKDEVLPAETSAPVIESHRSDSAISGVSEVEKVEVKVKVKVKAFELEGQDNRGGAEQDPRTQLHREDVVTDVEGEISALKPTEPVSVELDKVAKSKTKKNHKSAEDGKADDYVTGAEQDDEDDDEEENDENSDKNSKKFSLKPKRNLLKKIRQ